MRDGREADIQIACDLLFSFSLTPWRQKTIYDVCCRNSCVSSMFATGLGRLRAGHVPRPSAPFGHVAANYRAYWALHYVFRYGLGARGSLKRPFLGRVCVPDRLLQKRARRSTFLGTTALSDTCHWATCAVILVGTQQTRSTGCWCAVSAVGLFTNNMLLCIFCDCGKSQRMRKIYGVSC